MSEDPVTIPEQKSLKIINGILRSAVRNIRKPAFGQSIQNSLNAIDMPIEGHRGHTEIRREKPQRKCTLLGVAQPSCGGRQDRLTGQSGI